MRYIWQHIQAIIETYDGTVPLAHFLKGYFKQHPILGSRDRRILTAMTYSWYRCSKALNPTGGFTHEAVMDCMALCNVELPSIFPEYKAEERKSTLADLGKLFPFPIELSTGISKAEWLASMLVQPLLFIRIRKDKGKIISLLNDHNIPVTIISDNCLALPNGAKIDALLPPDAYVVQDASSQQTGAIFQPQKHQQWYDCCAGAGGKSLLLMDMEPGVRLTISDKRETIIHNLKQRFRQYRYELPVAHLTDVSNKILLDKALGSKQFDHIICDAPCSGSGTWARTPEQLYFFNSDSLNEFATLQQTIATNVPKYLKPGGRLIYITCSVFAQENEMVTEAIAKNTGMEITRQQLINGTAIKADSMFIALLQKAG